MAAIERTRSFRVLVSEEEQAMLRALAERDGVTASDYVRMFIRRDYAEKFGGPSKKTKPKR